MYIVSVEDTEKIVDMYKKKYNFTVIAKHFGISAKVVTRLLEDKGIYQEGLGRVRSLKELCGIDVEVSGWDKAAYNGDAERAREYCSKRGINLDDLISEYKSGTPVLYIANQHGISTSTVRNYLIAAGVFDSTTSVNRRTKLCSKSNVDEALENKVIAMRKRGVTYIEICKQLNICNNKVASIVKKHGATERKLMDAEKLDMILNLCKEGMNYSKISVEVGVSYYTVRRIAVKYEIRNNTDIDI